MKEFGSKMKKNVKAFQMGLDKHVVFFGKFFALCPNGTRNFTLKNKIRIDEFYWDNNMTKESLKIHGDILHSYTTIISEQQHSLGNRTESIYSFCESRLLLLFSSR